MLLLPEKFDENEWFIVISLILTYWLMLKLPKRFPLTITLLILFFGMSYVQVTDHIIGGSSFNMYDINDTGKFEWFDLIGWFIYPPFGYFFIYYFDKWSIRGLKIFWYILGWSVIAMLVEWISLKFHMFTYYSWKLSYSYPIYLITLSIYLLSFLYIKSTFKKLKKIQKPVN
ncbi:hypothetical protein [Neobacillus cucumis]|uniref:hypothetical protein n=1 Tax=Neobacillus cucumis TaxID=1740721 RepID=UPI00196402EB|nr:hypothetical protein [Neobacillus cucumis]MBM7654408.1 hypothetical protein [Neobacillus cucumis]